MRDERVISPLTSESELDYGAPSTRLLCSDHINPNVKERIANTLLKLKNNGLEEQTVKIIGYYLRHLAVNAD